MIIPVTTRAVAMKWIIMDLRSSFSRPNLGQMRVNKIPMKKITIGVAESEAAEARAMDGAMVSAAR